MVQKGGIRSLLILLTKSQDADAQRFAALALANASSACKFVTSYENILVYDNNQFPLSL